MLDGNSTSDVFRFIQARPPAPVDVERAVFLVAGSDFARELAGRSVDARAELATSRLDELEDSVSDRVASATASAVLNAADAVLESRGTLHDFLAKSEPAVSRSELEGSQVQLSDLLLAAKFARGARPRGIKQAARLFRLQDALLGGEKGNGRVELEEFLRQPLALPEQFDSTAASTPAKAPRQERPGDNGAADLTRAAEAVSGAIEELSSYAVPQFLQAHNGGSGVPFALTAAAVERLSAGTRETLKDLSIDPADRPLHGIMGELEAQLDVYGARLANTRPGGIAAGPEPEEEPRPYIKTVGVADLLLVKQHLKRYDRMDIAHVENIVAHEKKTRTHKSLERIEETFTVERETTQERETELETAERFEMQRETSKTIQEDQRFGFGLTVSGKYGPSVEFTSNAGADSSTSTEESVQSATTYAKDVMSRSLERVVERARQEQVLKIVREEEETNLHEFNNRTDDHVIGVYQFLEKVYESQVFNYGIRQLFDFMVPEPASYLWFLEGSPSTDLNLPTPPPRLASYAPTAESINPLNYLLLAALYGVEGLAPPPPFVTRAVASLQHGATDATEEGQPRAVVEKEIPVPDGYRPYLATVSPIALTDDHLTLGINVGRAQQVWQPAAGELTSVGSDHDLAAATLDLSLFDSEPYVSGSNLTVQVTAYETQTFGVSIATSFIRTPEAYTRWQIKTYDALATAYADAVREYEVKVAELKAAAENAARNETRFGNAPSRNATIVKDELRKHCISIITRQRFDAPNGMIDDEPPYFDFKDAEERGAFTRFFEQAFEWDQLQYVVYPYYWARKETWQQRLLREDVDPLFLEFLEAGAARVVVPVRPGFEVAVSHYLETGEIWNGEGDPPPINSPLYYPIVQEIMERTGASEGEIAVGDAWETHLPTPLVTLRREDSLPSWTRSDPDTWDWEEEA
jgi:hypothetical protein